MSKPIHNPSHLSRALGFSLLELMVALSLSLLLLGLAFSLLQQLDNTADLVGSMSDTNQNLRAAVNMVARDLSTAGQNIPVGGIPLPYTPGSPSPTPTVKPPNPMYPSANPWRTWTTFPTPPANSALYWPVITAGNAQGLTQGSGANAINTDFVTIIGVNQTSSFNPTAVNTTTSPPTFSSSAATITVSTTAAGYVQAGQLIMLTNANSSCLLAVSSVSTATGVITFTHSDTTNDTLGVNQFPTVSGSTGAITAGPTTGTILQLETATTASGKTTYSWPSTLTAYPISMVTYFLNTGSPQNNLTKLVTMGTNACTSVFCTQVVAVGINVMQVSYNLSPPATLNGVQADPTENPWPTTADPGNSPNNIRKVVLTVIAETDHKNFANGQWYSKEIKTAVTTQNLDYYNKYSLGASMTQN